MANKAKQTVFLKNEIYSIVKSDFDLMTKVMNVTQQRETTIFRWCREKSDNFLKYPILKVIADHFNKSKVEDVLEITNTK